MSNRLVFLIRWFESYTATWGNFPDPTSLTREHFRVLPENIARSADQGNGSPPSPISPKGRFSNVTTRFSTGSDFSNKSHYIKRNVKISVSDYPKFSGQAKDWVVFERKFRSVASTQGFDYILQDEKFMPTSPEEEEKYKEDTSFIYDAPWDPTTVNESLDDVLNVSLGYITVLGEFDLNSISLDISDLVDLGEATDVDINRAFRSINLQKNSNQVQNHYMYYKHTKMKNIDFEAQQPFLEFKPFKVATVYHIERKENVADILTKPTDGPTFRKHVKAVFMKL